jgi:hypothetical protein
MRTNALQKDGGKGDWQNGDTTELMAVPGLPASTLCFVRPKKFRVVNLLVSFNS